MATNKPKLIAVLAYLTFIGWIIALFLHQDHKSDLGTFHLRQALGLFILGALVGFVPKIGWLLSLAVLVLWFLGLVAAIQGERTPTPWLGEYFQRYLAFIR